MSTTGYAAAPTHPSRPSAPAGGGTERWIERFRNSRDLTEALAAPLGAEDQVVQSMPDVSPTKWHRAHTTWFYETFLLGAHQPHHRVVHPGYDYLFNSYYEQVGPRHPRAERGLLSRPTVAEVGQYRKAVDAAVIDLLESGRSAEAVAGVVELGVHHEQQHQELLLMDIKHVLSCNPLAPAYRSDDAASLSSAACSAASSPAPVGPVSWVEVTVPNDVAEVGRDAGDGFCFDNEGPRHRHIVTPFRIADRLVTCGEWLAFMADGGYTRPELWLSDGWATVQQQRWRAPLYWRSPHSSAGDRDDRSDWTVFTLGGERPVADDEPVCHVSFLEADAYARWAGARLPSEAEWEVTAVLHAAADAPNDLGTDALHPRPAAAGPAGGVRQLHGDVWEWTASPYRPYPGFVPAAGAIGEYNGKFMCNQMVLRGAACVTPAGHSRVTYRNFFPPAARWAFSGLRLAADA